MRDSSYNHFTKWPSFSCTHFHFPLYPTFYSLFLSSLLLLLPSPPFSFPSPPPSSFLFVPSPSLLFSSPPLFLPPPFSLLHLSSSSPGDHLLLSGTVSPAPPLPSALLHCHQGDRRGKGGAEPCGGMLSEPSKILLWCSTSRTVQTHHINKQYVG